MFAGGNDGVWRTTDGGATWTNVLQAGCFPRAMTRGSGDPDQPSTVYWAIDGGALDVSNDDGVSWQQGPLQVTGFLISTRQRRRPRDRGEPDRDVPLDSTADRPGYPVPAAQPAPRRHRLQGRRLFRTATPPPASSTSVTAPFPATRSSLRPRQLASAHLGRPPPSGTSGSAGTRWASRSPAPTRGVRHARASSGSCTRAPCLLQRRSRFHRAVAGTSICTSPLRHGSASRIADPLPGTPSSSPVAPIAL